jgi:RNA polymerase sigma factor (sigma-70 family)
MGIFSKSYPPRELSDEELIAQYRSDGNPVWVGELFDRYTHLVFLVCMKYLKDELESEDMSMRVFEKLMEDLKKYEIKTFRYWLHTVVKNQCLVHLERQKRHREQADHHEQQVKADLWLELRSLSNNGNGQAQNREAQLLLMEEAMGLLKDEQRRCLDLFYLQQKSYQEVAEVTGFSLKQVKSYLQNGKRMLRKHLEEHPTFKSEP